MGSERCEGKARAEMLGDCWRIEEDCKYLFGER